jgi:hypothetical protein
MARGSSRAETERRVTKVVPTKEYAVTNFNSKGRKEVFGKEEPFYAKYRAEAFTPEQRIELVNKTKEEYQSANQNLDQGVDYLRGNGLQNKFLDRAKRDRLELIGSFGSKTPYPDIGVNDPMVRDAVSSLFDARSTGHIGSPEDLKAKLGYGDTSPFVRFDISPYDAKKGGVYVTQSVFSDDEDGGGETQQPFHFIPIRQGAEKGQDYANAKAVAAYLDYFVPRTSISANGGAR